MERCNDLLCPNFAIEDSDFCMDCIRAQYAKSRAVVRLQEQIEALRKEEES